MPPGEKGKQAGCAASSGRVLDLRTLTWRPLHEEARSAPRRTSTPKGRPFNLLTDDPLVVLTRFEEAGLRVRPDGVSLETLAAELRRRDAARAARRAVAKVVEAEDLRVATAEASIDRSATNVGDQAGELGANARAGASAPLSVGDLDTALPGEEAVPPQAKIGFNSMKFRFEDRGDKATYGTFDEILRDAVATGAGVLRHLQDADLLWESLFPAETRAYNAEALAGSKAIIPPPGELYARLTEFEPEDDPFWRFSLAVIQAAREGIALVPTLFTVGGAGLYNQAGHGYFEGDETLWWILNQDEGHGAPDYILSTAPPHQKMAIVPSGAGWDEYYYVNDHLNDFDRNDPELSILAPYKRMYQQFALTLATEGTAYEQECARRKCLALTAFGQAVGRYLARLASKLEEGGSSLEAVVPRIELGNEMEIYWQLSADDFDQNRVWLIAKEYARFICLLSVSVRQEYPSARFTFGALFSPIETEVAAFEHILEWYVYVVQAIPYELTYFFSMQGQTIAFGTAWDQYSVLGFYEEWVDAWYQGEWLWPSNDPAMLFADDPARLLSRLGIHWYHHWDVDPEDVPTFLPATRLATDSRDALQVCNSYGVFALELEVSEVGFMAETPPEPALAYFRNANPRYQAGMLVQRLLTPLAVGASTVMWHSYMSNVWQEGRDWSLFTSMGVRNDVLHPGEGKRFLKDTHATARPSWFSFRRVAWLLERTSTIEWAQTLGDAGALIRLTSNAKRFRVTGTRAWKYAYVTWLGEVRDFDDDTTPQNYASFYLNGGTEYELLPIVPDVVEDPARLGELDDNGFPAWIEAEWRWEGWDDIGLWPDVREDRVIVSVKRGEVSPATDSRPRVYCILCDMADSELP